VQSQTFEFSADHRFTDIRKRTQQALFSLSARQLYSCEGLDCGSSNVWANEVFKVKQLYGLDQNQDYSVWELMRANEIRYAVVYLTQRGNRRSYMQVEFVVPTRVSENGLAASPKSILSAIQSNGYYVVPGNISMPEGNPHIEAIVTALNRMPLLKFAVVGHAAVEASLDGNIATSLAIANGVSDALQAGGVSESRMLVKGVGSLVPEASSKPLRVVLVKL
jgi:Outer membrane protein and related peptidoglycan-associated (lipo)proteins